MNIRTMGRAVKSEWRKLPLSLTELSIDITLRCGQSFRWRKDNDEWSCTLYGRIVSLRQDSTHLHYRVTWPETLDETHETRNHPINGKLAHSAPTVDDTEALLRHYLALKVDLESLYQHWSKADLVFRKKAPKFTGVRILSQDSWETLISFICSSNNNISRISQMVNKLCINYGQLIGFVGDQAFYDFPPPEALTGAEVESHLRTLGFGYRAKYIAQTARTIAEKPPGWLDSLRSPENPRFMSVPKASSTTETSATYKDAHRELLQLSGVGPKVADCVCLMGLGWAEAVPIDTHVWQIAQRDYKYGNGRTKTFSTGMYESVGDFFRTLWGKEAGWAHSVLFTADLKAFADRKIKKEEAAEVSEIETTVSRKRRRDDVVVKTEDGTKTKMPELETSTKRRTKRSLPRRSN